MKQGNRVIKNTLYFLLDNFLRFGNEVTRRGGVSALAGLLRYFAKAGLLRYQEKCKNIEITTKIVFKINFLLIVF